MKKIRNVKFVTLLLVLLLAITAVACNPEQGNEQAKTSKTNGFTEAVKTENKEAETFVFTDSAGREVTLPKKIERIVPSGPLAQQFLLSIAGDKMVALARSLDEETAHYIGEQYLELPEIGQFFGSKDMNMEELARLEPQVVIDVGEPKGDIVADMDTITEQTAIPAIFIEADMDKSGDAYRTLGKLLDKEEKANELADYCDSVYKNIQEKMQEIPEDERASFAYLQGETGLNALAKGTYHATIMDMIGTNVVEVEEPSSRGSGNEINIEQLLVWDPEYLFIARASVYDDVADDETFNTLSAVKEGKYYEVPNEPYNWLGAPPSVNRYMGLQWMPYILYPEVFDYDMKDVTQKYYKLFYDYDLSDEECDDLLRNSLLDE